ncbi:sorting nexin-4-like [Gigantopelta aegis]|uniref:sorting nexin-4-like n=1 Tax=Gigantopelta aegis TaxID=1735272 RepID=UPI001B88A141|nr:sorting nexin-4-like [Gigantopelta aegis]
MEADTAPSPPPESVESKQNEIVCDTNKNTNPTTISHTTLLQWMDITVLEPEKRTNTSMKMQDTYIVYLVETRVTDENMKGYGERTTSLWRRYSEFELLRNYLDIMYPAIVIPPLPEKKATYTWLNSPTDKLDPEFVERRRNALEIFLLRIAAHPVICSDKIFMAFLQQENSWKEMVYSTDFQSKADSRLKALNASFRLKKPDRRFEEIKNYSNELQNNISNILKIRAKICDRLYGIHKVHANYARVFGEWSSIEKEMAEALQSTGHYMDVYASSIDGILDETEQYADQLKEYLAFGESLRSVCRKYECMQYDLERAEDGLSSKAAQRDVLSQGKAPGSFSISGMKSKIFGNDTPEQRDEKIKQLDEQIQQAEVELQQTNEETAKFVEAALRDTERFKRQKAKDLQEIFTNFAIMQIKECKKGIAIWTSAKDCMSKI